jgi:glycosyltransferase involved in cell wall biosynthesis/GT2 family glycosyltransferase
MVTNVLPTCSVVIPCRNERAHIGQVLADLAVQDFSEPFEVIVAEGRSDDGTRELLGEQQAPGRLPYPLFVIDNPQRGIPMGLNLAVAASRGSWIVRIDGHSRIGTDYLSTILKALRQGIDVAGPRLVSVAGGNTLTASSIALLLGTWLGTGGTPSRGVLTQKTLVRHTVMSCYRREVWAAIGGYDEALASNEDFDFDWRASQAGAVVASLPKPEFRLTARTTLRALFIQRWRYGFWKAAVLARHPASLHLRQLVPLLALVMAVAMVGINATWALGLAAGYLGLCHLSALRAALVAGWRMGPTLYAIAVAPVIYAIIHGVWGLGTLIGLICNRPRPVLRPSTPLRPPATPDGLRIAVVHEWLEVCGGSEAVVAEILACYPEAALFALVDHRDARTDALLGGRPAFTTFIQRLPWSRRWFRYYYPLFPLAIESLRFDHFDVVISSSHAVAKGVITAPHQIHLSYCHSPMRYAWDQQGQYLRPSLRALPVILLLHALRIWDAVSAARVDGFLANSHFVASRIRKFYRREAEVLHPPVVLNRFQPGTQRDDFYLSVGRQVPYKRTDLIISAFNAMPERRLLVVGDGPEHERLAALAGPNVTLHGHLSDARVAELLSRCRGFVFAGVEDFGITLVEAQASGAPVIAFNRGGASEIIIDGRTGLLFHEQTAVALRMTVERLESLLSTAPGCFDAHAISASAQRFSQAHFRRGLTAALERAIAEHSLRHGHKPAHPVNAEPVP